MNQQARDVIVVGQELHDPSHTANLWINADALLLCEQLTYQLQENSNATWLKRWKQADQIAKTVLQRENQDLWEGSIVQTVVAALPEDAALHIANSMPIRDVESFAASSKRLKVFVNRGVSGIDGTLASALGEACVQDAPVFLLCGDLAFLHDSSSLALAKQSKDLTIVLINNGGGGIFQFLPIAQNTQAFETYFLTAQEHVTFASLCAGMNVAYEPIESLHALGVALQKPYKGVRVLEINTTGIDNVKKHRDAWQRVSEALRAKGELL